MTQRRFVLKPLSLLNADWQVDGLSVVTHLAALTDDPAEVSQALADWLPVAEYPLTSLDGLAQRKKLGPPVTVLTAYDYPTARLMDEAGIDLILVGDSLGMVVLGLPDTTHVTMAHMLHHTEAVARGAKRARIIADLPYHSYLTPAQAVENAQRLIQAGAHAVKLEGGVSQLLQVQAILAAGIPLVGHIGMLPQSILEEGGRYKKKGKTTLGATALMRDAQALADSGVQAMVLESVVPEVATQITQTIPAITIGIGSGNATDGQVLVVSDLVGGFPWFRPPFATVHADTAGQTRQAIEAFIRQTLSAQ
jgi:3-methyl-2-oxobutanoate hydroxymethyltransferase